MEHSLSANRTMWLCACVLVCGCAYSHYTLERAWCCCRGAAWQCQCHHQLGDKMFSPEVTSSHLFSFFFSLPPCYNEAAIQSTMQTSTREDVLQSHGCFVFLLFLWPVLAARLFWSSSVLLSAAILRCLDVAQRALSETRGWEWAASPSQGVPMVDCQSH